MGTGMTQTHKDTKLKTDILGAWRFIMLTCNSNLLSPSLAEDLCHIYSPLSLFPVTSQLSKLSRKD